MKIIEQYGNKRMVEAGTICGLQMYDIQTLKNGEWKSDRYAYAFPQAKAYIDIAKAKF